MIQPMDYTCKLGISLHELLVYHLALNLKK